MAFFYKNIPPFELKAGDVLAFDLRSANDTDIELEIGLAPTTTNGDTQEAQPFQTVVTTDQRPTGRGDTIVGNFDLQYTAQAPFSFPGGGLAIRFSNPTSAYLADTTCNENLVGAHAGTSEPLFVQRAYQDADGVFPWPNGDPGSIGAFR